MLNKKQDVKEIEIVFERLMAEHGEALARLAYTYIKDRSRVEDIIQDVFLRAFRSYSGFRGEADIKTWLYRITINRCKDELRSWSFRKLFYTDEVMDWRMDRGTEPTPELKLITKHENQQLGEAILQLPIKLREVIILFYYQDFSVEQIAKMLGITQNTVKTRLFRGRKKLAELIPDMEKEG